MKGGDITMIYRMRRALYLSYRQGSKEFSAMTHDQIVAYIDAGLCVTITDVVCI